MSLFLICYFIAAVTICSDFSAAAAAAAASLQLCPTLYDPIDSSPPGSLVPGILEPNKIKSLTLSIVSPSICHEVMGPEAMVFSECWVLSQIFHSPLSLSSKASLVFLRFLPWEWCHLHIWGYWYFFRQTSSLCFIQPGILPDVLCIEV